LRFVVLGDLHLDPRDAATFARARAQLRALEPDVVICLGDLGVGRESGTPASFEQARDWLASLGTRYEAIIGNHDLERLEAFASDQEAVRGFCDAFERERPYGTIELGRGLGVLLSSTGFRSNRGYCHEVSVDDAQFAWFRGVLEANRDRPTLVFSHAPPLGSQLQVLQDPHLRAGNAWLNQSDRPRRFVDLVAAHRQVRLWFSAHNHLGQAHPRAVSHVGNCLFVHTGVIGRSTRDGRHHSRIVDWDGERVRIDTLDHATGAQVRDVAYALGPNTIERADSSASDSSGFCFAAPGFDEIAALDTTLELAGSAFAAHRDMLVEYDRELRDPVGVVEDGLGRRRFCVDDDHLVITNWWGHRQIETNTDGYYFKVPTRKRHGCDKVRNAIRRTRKPGTG